MKFKFRYIISKGKLILCNKIMRICNFHADSLAEKKMNVSGVVEQCPLVAILVFFRRSTQSRENYYNPDARRCSHVYIFEMIKLTKHLIVQ